MPLVCKLEATPVMISMDLTLLEAEVLVFLSLIGWQKLLTVVALSNT
jgi:hypothetical protein